MYIILKWSSNEGVIVSCIQLIQVKIQRWILRITLLNRRVSKKTGNFFAEVSCSIVWRMEEKNKKGWLWLRKNMSPADEGRKSKSWNIRSPLIRNLENGTLRWYDHVEGMKKEISSKMYALVTTVKNGKKK